MRAITRIMDTKPFKKQAADTPKNSALQSGAPEKPASRMKQAVSVTWGRTSTPQLFNNVGAAVMVAWCPIWMWMNWAALEHFDGSLVATVRGMHSPGLPNLDRIYFPQHSHCVAVGYMGWIAFQALLYHYLPGKTCQGQQTPGGNVLSYTTNGLLAFLISLFLFVAGSAAGFIRPTLIADH